MATTSPIEFPTRFRLPREHGFWVMLGAVQLSTLVSTGFAPRAVGTALLLSVALIAGAGWVGKAVRRQERLQLSSTALVGWSGFPVALAGAQPWWPALGRAGTWVLVVLALALAVRAVLARARRQLQRARRLGYLSTGLPAVASIVALTVGAERPALALGAAGLMSMILFALEPAPRRLRRIGLGSSAVLALVAVLLS